MNPPKSTRVRDDQLSAKTGQAWEPESVVGPIRKRLEGAIPWAVIFLMGLLVAIAVALSLWILRMDEESFDWWWEQLLLGQAMGELLAMAMSAFITWIVGAWRWTRRRRAEVVEPPQA